MTTLYNFCDKDKTNNADFKPVMASCWRMIRYKLAIYWYCGVRYLDKFCGLNKYHWLRPWRLRWTDSQTVCQRDMVVQVGLRDGPECKLMPWIHRQTRRTWSIARVPQTLECKLCRFFFYNAIEPVTFYLPNSMHIIFNLNSNNLSVLKY